MKIKNIYLRSLVHITLLLYDHCDTIVLMDFVWRWSETLPLRTTNCFKWRYISNGFVLCELKRQKAHGVDKLPSGMLKDCQVHIYQPLGHIINVSLQYSKVSSMWKIAKVIPIHKKGAHNNPENYRPISVFTRII